MDIQWEEPPAELLERVPGGKAHYAEFAAALKEHKDKWAVMPPPKAKTERTEKSAAAVAQNIRRGKIQGFTRGEFQAVAKGSKVWVRYTGPKELPEAPPLKHDDIARRARAWARDQGMNVSTRGNLSQDIIDAYCRAAGIDRRPRAVG